MMKTRIIIRYAHVALFVVLTLLNFGHTCLGKRLPSIWSENEDGHGEVEQSYFFRSELQLLDSGKSFMIEEWASSPRQVFRLDTIETTSGKRSTLLVHKNTEENFLYEPFSCSLVKDAREALCCELADKFPSSDSFLPAGIGSLWLHALKLEANFTDPEYSEFRENKITAGTILKSFAKYTLPITDNYPYNLNFYFSSESDPKSLSIIELGREIIGKEEFKVIARFNLIKVEIPYKITTNDNNDKDYISDVFDLPVGYGCEHSVKFDHPFVAPVNIIGTSSNPLLLQLNIVTLQPSDFTHDFDKWKSHSTLIRLVAGRLNLNENNSRNYVVVETQDYAPESQSPKIYGSQIRRATLRRLKRVWDLGNETLNSDGKMDKEPAMYFEIDERRSKCLGYGESDTGESKSIEFEITSSLNHNGQRSSGEAEIPFGLGGLTLSTSLIEMLFSSTDGYHLIKESESRSKASFESYVYERRINSFEMRNKEKQIIWSAPVSIVREHSFYIDPNTGNQKRIYTTGNEVQTSIIMLFLSKSLDKIVTKIHLTVVNHEIINEANFHRELYVGLCFDQLAAKDKHQASYARKLDRNELKSLDFTLKYPIELSDEIVENLWIELESSIYQQFLSTMFVISDSRLDLLQLIEVEINFDTDEMKIQGKLIDKPNLLNYRRVEGQKFSHLKRHSLFKLFKLNEESCAESCNDYNCSMFTYCPRTEMCDLLMNEKDSYGEVMTFEPDPSCNLFRLRVKQQNTSMNPRQLIKKLRETILAQNDLTEQSPLTLKANYIASDGSEQELKLIPRSIDSGMFLAKKVDDLIGDIEGEQPPSYQSQINARSDFFMSPKYELIFTNRKYKNIDKVDEQFPIKLAQHINYEDCESLCDETDCRSFSYCQIEQNCQVSQLHQPALIEELSEQEDFCFFMSRDYLSKFQKTSQVTRSTKAQKSLKSETKRNCAVSCMEEKTFNCRSFYYCSDDEQKVQDDCYLRKSYSRGVKQDTAGNSTCYLYTRSFLADFDKFYGMSLPDSSNGGETSTIFRDSGAEVCAGECAAKDGDCLAFHVCRSGLAQQPTCALFIQLAGETANGSGRPSPEHLVNNAQCITFIVSPASGLNLLRGGKNFKPIDEIKTDDDLEISPEVANLYHGSNWFSKLIILIFGMTMGSITAYLYRRHRQQ